MISLALCTYNGDAFLQEQLDSIFSQTLLPSEIVVCDDGSTDESVAILREFSQKASFPIHIHVNENNLGVARNFGKAISLCKGHYIALCDQDDVWEPEKLEKLAHILDANPDAGYVFSDAELVDRNLQPLNRKLWDEKPNTFTFSERKNFPTGDQFGLLIKKNVVTGACMMFRSSVVKILLPVPPSWIHDYWIAIVASSMDHRGVAVNEPLIKYRQHETQQIGVMKGGFLSKLGSGLRKWPDLLERDTTRIEALQEHLVHLGARQEILDKLGQKSSFLESRLNMLSGNCFSRMIPAARMLSEHLYNYYSPYGWRAFLMDILTPRKKASG